jgi:PmbA protein
MIPQTVVERALQAGATAAEGIFRQGDEFSVTVRLGDIESLKEAGSKALGLRVLIGQRAASAYTSDFSDAGLERLVASAVAMARLTSDDPHAGLPDRGALGKTNGDLGLYHEDVPALSTADRIAMARRAEAAALAVDSRVMNSEGGSLNAVVSRTMFANSLGFAGEYRRSRVSLSVVPVAGVNGELQRDYWYTAARCLAALEDAEQVGRIAAQRALRRLGARKIPTCRVPVIFEARAAGSLLAALCDAVSGDAVYRQATYLAGRLGERVAAPGVSVWDDGAMPGGFGTQPFDDEGVPTRRTSVVEDGILRNHLLNSYTGRKLGRASTGNASRGLAGNPVVGPGNFFLQAGTQTPEQLIGSVARGLLVTEMLGSGVNLVTGDYSRGAAGFWIEKGEIAYPVQEVTVAGNLLDMWQGVEAVANDLVFRSAIAAPAIKIAEMTVAGR